jgi:hypothetical protein
MGGVVFEGEKRDGFELKHRQEVGHMGVGMLNWVAENCGDFKAPWQIRGWMEKEKPRCSSNGAST